MSELIPFGGDIAKARRDIRVALIKLDGLAEFNDRATEYLIDLAQRAQIKTNLCPGVAPVVADFIRSYCLDAMALQHRMYREL